MFPLAFRLLPRLLAALACGEAGASDLTVDPVNGNDAAPAGPFKTIARAIKVAGPGHTIHLTPATYHESAGFLNRSGEAGRPITLDGHGATLDGSEPLKPADWEMVAPGLYRNACLLRTSPSVLGRWYFLFDGRMNHMGRTSKGPRRPFKKPDDLAAGEWTFVEDPSAPRRPKTAGPPDAHPTPGAFYIKIDPAKTLADCRVAAPLRANGVAISGRCSHLVIRNLTSTHVHNDGFNIHGYTRDIVFENIKAIDCGDDGISAHDDCQIRVRGLTSIGNSTGICDVGHSESDYDRVFIRDCLGYDLFFLDTNRHSVSNAVVFSSAASTLTVAGRANTNAVCTLTLDNVFIQRVTGTNEVRVMKNAVLDARHVTLLNLNVLAAGGETRLRDSLVAGSPPPTIGILAGAKWLAERNVYDLRSFGLDKAVFTPETFGDYQRRTGQDKASKWTTLQFTPAANGKLDAPKVGTGIGADLSRLATLRE